MKKKTGMGIGLLLIPLAVVGIATTPNSVTVVHNGETMYTSFATAISGSNVGWCAPVALILSYALFALAVIYGLSKKQIWLKAIRAGSFAAAFLAAIPIVVRGEIMIVPNVLATILLVALWAVAQVALNPKGDSEEKKAGPRLS